LKVRNISSVQNTESAVQKLSFIDGFTAEFVNCNDIQKTRISALMTQGRGSKSFAWMIKFFLSFMKFSLGDFSYASNWGTTAQHIRLRCLVFYLPGTTPFSRSGDDALHFA
jgi:hypothetical protein